MNAADPVQRQLDACNDPDLQRDPERITGLRDQPFEAAVVFEVTGGLMGGLMDGLISKVWFFNAE